MAYILPDTELLTLKQIAEQGNQATFEIEPLSPGYGVTLGNSLRRILLSSLEGAAITSARIDGATHEFTTIPGVREDIVTVSLNLKQVRVRLHGDGPANLILQKKGPGVVTAADFKANASVDFLNPEQVIATLDKGASFNMEIEVRKGRGYSPVEARRDEKLPLGTIALDSIFSPVVRVTYDVENTRVGNLTNYDKLTMVVTTDGSVTPQDALQTAAKIAVEHFSVVAGIRTEMPSEEDLAVIAVDTTAEEAVATAETEEAPKKRATRKKAATKEEE